MPGGPVTIALFGKLPAHGDFVRRGEASAAALLDAWLTGEMERLAAAHGDALDTQLEGLGCWAFVGAFDLVGALAGSWDRVGRVFPVAAVVPGGRAAAAAAAALLARALVEVMDADALAAALAALLDGSGEDDTPSDDTGHWWRPLDAQAASFAIAGLPVGADFDRLLVAAT